MSGLQRHGQILFGDPKPGQVELKGGIVLRPGHRFRRNSAIGKALDKVLSFAGHPCRNRSAGVLHVTCVGHIAILLASQDSCRNVRSLLPPDGLDQRIGSGCVRQVEACLACSNSGAHASCARPFKACGVRHILVRLWCWCAQVANSLRFWSVHQATCGFRSSKAAKALLVKFPLIDGNRSQPVSGV